MKNLFQNSKKILSTLFSAFAIVLAIAAVVLMQNGKKNGGNFSITRDEIEISKLLEAREPNVVSGEDIDFKAFFLRDTDGDGYTEDMYEIDQTIGETDYMFVEVNVQSAGKLKNGKIKINDSNFIWKTAILSNSIIKNNYIGDTSEIELNDLNSGTQILIYGKIRSKIGTNIHDFDKESLVTLTGTYVDDEENESELTKESTLKVNWNGTVSTSIPNSYSTVYNIENAIGEEEFTANFSVSVNETRGQLLMKKQEVQITIPQLNGFNPTSVTCTSGNVEQSYDDETRTLLLQREAVVDENGNITKSVSRSNSYSIKAVYPIEAYESLGSETVLLNVPVTGTNYGYLGEKFGIAESTASKNLSIVYKVIQTVTPTPYVREDDTWNFYTTVGAYTSKDGDYAYRISKENVQNLYDGNVYEDITDTYKVCWQASVGQKEKISKITLEATSIDKFDNATSMEDYETTTGVYFENAQNFLGNDGKIELYTAEGGLIETFTKNNWSSYSATNPYKINEKSIKVVTSVPVSNTYFYVYQIKELDDEKIVEDYTQAQFNSISRIYTYAKGSIEVVEGKTSNTATVQNKTASALYEMPISRVSFSSSPAEIANHEVQNVTLTISTASSNEFEKKWKNGTFLVQLPKDIISADITSVTISNIDVTILSSLVYRENGIYYVRIDTENEEPATYSITLNLSVRANPLQSTKTGTFKLYASNKECEKYNTTTADIHDINNNGSTQDQVAYRTRTINLIASQGLITEEYITDYNDDENAMTISPNIAEIDRSDDTKTAKINVSIANNYTEAIDEITILGKIPYEGNKYVLNENNLGSEYTAHIKGAITVPAELQSYATVYYSTAENPTNDLTDVNNGWTQTVTDWTTVKSYLIDLGDYVLRNTGNKVFSYEVEVPARTGFNKAAFTTHAVYYCLNTEVGKYQTQTQAGKVGLQVVQKYNLELTKNKQNYNNILVPGATYKFTTQNANGENESRAATTGQDGSLTINGLYVGREYTLKEISSPSNYELNNNEIKFNTNIVDNGGIESLTFTTTSGNFNGTPVVTTSSNGDYLVKAKVQDEAKYTLIINTQDEENNPLTDVRYAILGKNQGKMYRDNNNQVKVAGLYLNEEYQIQLMKSVGYYTDEAPRTFTLVRDENTNNLKIVTENQQLSNAIIVEEIDGQSVVTITITAEKIPTYNLQILKIEEPENEEAEIVYLTGAQFKFSSDDTLDTNVYTVEDANGISISGLYNYVENKSVISGKYTLQEIKAPEGYSNNAEEITFYVEKTEEGQTIHIENEKSLKTIHSTEIIENTLVLTIQDKPLFKLTKKDSEQVDEHGNPLLLPDAKFVIKELDNHRTPLDFAKDVNGNYVGEYDELTEQYIVTTDANGQISVPLRAGEYMIKEIGYPEGYFEDNNIQVFKIYGEISEEAEEKIVEINYIEDLVDLSTDVNSGSDYSKTTVKLMRTLDFNDSNSYRNPSSTDYGDYNEDGKIENTKKELTTGKGFTPIGTNNSTFNGVFEGQGFNINNLYVNRPICYVGLFGYTDGAKIKDLGLSGRIIICDDITKDVGGLTAHGIDCDISGCNSSVVISTSTSELPFNVSAGGIAGQMNISNVHDCYNTGRITSSSDNNYVGGIIARAQDCTVRNCYNTGTLSGYGGGNYAYIGGIVGYANGTRVYNSYNKGEGYGRGRCVNMAGIVGSLHKGGIYNSYNQGYMYESTTAYSDYDRKSCGIGGIAGCCRQSSVHDCYNTSGLSGKTCTGGIVGTLNDSSSHIYRCYNIGTISAPVWFGGIVGYAEKGDISNCYNKGSVNASQGYNGSNAAGGIVGIALNNAKITNCYNLGNVKSRLQYNRVGGIVAHKDNNVTITNCCYSDAITLDAPIISEYGTELTVEEMKSTNFVHTLGNETWVYDIDSTNDGYPIIRESLSIEDGYVSINCIEDLLDFSYSVNEGHTYNNTKIKLEKTLDFNDNNSYRNTEVNYYGDINDNGVVEDIKTELTTGNGFVPIGNQTGYFNGTFDGQGYEIRNLYINRNQGYVGLFGYLYQNAEIIELGVRGNINNSNDNYYYSYTGGIVGYAYQKIKIIDCYFVGDVNDNSIKQKYVGGIIGGTNGNALISRCYSVGDVVASNGQNVSYVGGIVGGYGPVDLSNCYSMGNVSSDNSASTNSVGGLVGYTTAAFKISNCYTTKNVSSSSSGSGNVYAGKIIGYSTTAIITNNCYYLESSTISGNNTYLCGTAKTEADMKNEEFAKALGYVAWTMDENNINNGFPVLKNGQDMLDEVLEINYIEDLVKLSVSVNNGNNYEGKTIVLERDLDFNDIDSYRDSTTTLYGDINENGIVEDIKTELTTGKGFEPIGNTTSNTFDGMFDGQGHEINNLYINKNTSHVGLFGNISNASISNVGISGNVENALENASVYIGIVVGYANNSSIENCYSSGKVIGEVEEESNQQYARMYEGGLLGCGAGACTIKNCHNTAKVIAKAEQYFYCGGLIGLMSSNTDSKVSNCYNSGDIDIISKNANIGGLIGQSDVLVEDCYNEGSITTLVGDGYTGSTIYLGGICGYAGNEINSCHNVGNIINTANASDYIYIYAGGIAGQDSTSSELLINTCINEGSISNTFGRSNRTYYYVGGILGAGEGGISNCHNIGELSAGTQNYGSRYGYMGGIIGRVFNNDTARDRTINCCYNTGNITGEAIPYMGGISGYIQNCIINDCYNMGTLKGNNVSGGIVGSVASTSTISNCYNIGDIEGNYIGGVIGSGSGENVVTIDNTYYSSNANISGLSVRDYGIKLTETEMCTKDFYNDLNCDEVWQYNVGDFPTLGNMDIIPVKIDQTTELVVENTIKKFIISTTMEGIDGGIVNGEDEIVQYGESNSTAIQMIPNQGYRIVNITINGKEIVFDTEEDGSYTIPSNYFTNITEDKDICVTFAASDSIITINKKDEDDNSKVLEGAKFEITTDSRPEITNEIGNLEKNGTYYFNEIDGKYVSNNKNMSNSTAYSYIALDLRNRTGDYTLKVNAEVSSQASGDYGYAIVNNSRNAPGYSTSTGRFIYISGSNSAKDYTTTLIGGSMYYLHLGYYKNSTIDSGEDQFIINKIELSPSRGGYYSNIVITNELGQAKAVVPGDATLYVREIEAPEGYTRNTNTITYTMVPGQNNELVITNKEQTQITVHHYYKGTTNKVAEDEIYKGDLGTEYSISPKNDLEKLVLAKDENDEFIIPEYAEGLYEQDREITFYYELEPVYLTIHHYIEGTETKIVNDEIIEQTASISFSGEHEYSVSANASYVLNSNENYGRILRNYNFVGFVTDDEEEYSIDDTFEYSKDTELTYVYMPKEYQYTINLYYEDAEDEQIITKAYYLDKISLYANIKNGYYIDRAEAINQDGEIVDIPLVIGEIEENNVINIYCKKIRESHTVQSEYNSFSDEGAQKYRATYILQKTIDGQTTNCKNENNEDISVVIVGNASYSFEELVSYDGENKITYSASLVKIEINQDGWKELDNAEYQASRQEISSLSEKYSITRICKYKINYYYENVKDDNETIEQTAEYLSQINNYTAKTKTGYTFDEVEVLNQDGETVNLPLVIGENEDNNIINVYYKKIRENRSVSKTWGSITQEEAEKYRTTFVLKKTVNGVKSNYKDENDEDVIVTIVGNGSSSYEGLPSYEENYRVTYRFEETKVEINQDGWKDLSADQYSKSAYNYSTSDQFTNTRVYTYTVHYFYEQNNGEYIEDTSKIDSKTANYKANISSYTGKNKTGYSFNKVEALNQSGEIISLPLVIGENSEYNVINVYYKLIRENHSVEKVWRDITSEEAEKYESTFVLQKTINGVTTNCKDENNQDITCTITGNGTYTFEGLPSYDENDRITYSVKQISVTKDGTTVLSDDEHIAQYQKVSNTSDKYTDILTTQYKVQNEWSISNPEESKNYRSTFVLYKTDGESEPQEVTDIYEINVVKVVDQNGEVEYRIADTADTRAMGTVVGNGTITFANLPKYENGKELTYSVEEVKIEVTDDDGISWNERNIDTFVITHGTAEGVDELITNGRIFNITTKIENGEGTITGEFNENFPEEDGIRFVESVYEGSDGTTDIEIIPSNGNEILYILINGEVYDFTPDQDGKVIIPSSYFTNVTSDYSIEMAFGDPGRTIKVIKTDEDGNRLEGAKFRISSSSDSSSGLADCIGDMTQYSSYYFVPQQDGSYINNNQRVSNSVAVSYSKIDLSRLSGTYTFSVNAEISSEDGNDYGYIVISKIAPGEATGSSSSTSSSTSSSDSAGIIPEAAATASSGSVVDETCYLVRVSGEKDAQDYRAILEGGETYYIYYVYGKNDYNDYGSDTFTIRNISLTETSIITDQIQKYDENSSYYFEQQDNGTWVSNNSWNSDTTAISYMEIDLENESGEYDLVINAKVSSYENYDWGYIVLSEDNPIEISTGSSTSSSTSSGSGFEGDSVRYIMRESGEVPSRDYTTQLEGGKKYYVYFVYGKSNNGSSGDDRFTINSVTLESKSAGESAIVVTNSNGEAFYEPSEYGTYKVKEIKAPPHYIMTEEEKEVELVSTEKNQSVTFINRAILFDITTEVGNNTSGERAGGTITGEYTDEYPEENYKKLSEKVMEAHDALNDIVINPSVGYKVESIKVNNKNYTFTPDENGNVVISKSEFTNVTKNQHIIVRFAEEEKTITIVKTDKRTGNPLPGAKFKFTSNFEREQNLDYLISEMYKGNDDYYFVYNESNGTYTNNNKNQDDTVAYGYKIVDLSEIEGNRTLTINAKVSSESGYDYGYVVYAELDSSAATGTGTSTSTGTVENSDYNYDDMVNPVEMFRISGDEDSQDYTVELEGGKKYIVYFVYGKDSSNSYGTDTFTINSIHLDSFIGPIVAETGLTDENGIATAKITGYGEYTVQEIVTPDDYVTMNDMTYELVASDTNPTLNIENVREGENKSTYTVNYYEKGTTTPIETAKTSDEVDVGSTITSSEEVIDIDGFVYDSVDVETLTIGSNAEENVINIYYTRLNNLSYTIHHVLKARTRNIIYVADDITVGNQTFGDVVTVHAQDVPGYRKLEPTTADITITTGTNEYTFYYEEDDFNYTVHYFYDGVEDESKLETLTGMFNEVISTYEDKIEPGYALSGVSPVDPTTGELALKITNNSNDNVIDVFYRTEYKITTEAKVHTERYIDGTTTNIKGGSISGDGLTSYENVFKGEDSTKAIVIVPNSGYEIVSVKVNDESIDYAGLLETSGSLTLNAANGFFTNMDSNKHVEVEFRKKSSVVVKYLEKDTNEVLSPEETISGYDEKAFETSRKNVNYYRAVNITDEEENEISSYGRVTSDNVVSASGTMYADTLTIIYWYERIPAGIIVKHIAINEVDKQNLTLSSGELLDEEDIDGYVGLTETATRKVYSASDESTAKYKDYVAVNGPAASGHIVIAAANENSKSATYQEDTVVEIRFYYEKQHKVTTEVIPHDETVEDETISVAGGTISGSSDEVYEVINEMGYNTKEIVITPNTGYRVKEITINGTMYPLSELSEGEAHVITLGAGSTDAFFKNVQEDKHVTVKFERIPARVIVKYKDVATNEEVIGVPEKVVEGYVGKTYNEPAVEVPGYIKATPTEEYPEPISEGVMGENPIEIVHWYTKQFTITVDAEEGGTGVIEGDVDAEVVTRGNSNRLKITIRPNSGYKLDKIFINDEELDYMHDENIVIKFNSLEIPERYFTDIQENKHIVIKFAKIDEKSDDTEPDDKEDKDNPSDEKQDSDSEPETEPAKEKQSRKHKSKSVKTGDVITYYLAAIVISGVIMIVAIRKKIK